MTREGAVVDVHRPECPTREVLDRITERWATLILGVLADGPMRFGELTRIARDMNPRMLSRTLRGLERDGLVDREVIATQPPAVRYALTDLGMALDALLAPLRSWSENNIEGIHDARRRFDAAVDREDRTPWQRGAG